MVCPMLWRVILWARVFLLVTGILAPMRASNSFPLRQPDLALVRLIPVVRGGDYPDY